MLKVVVNTGNLSDKLDILPDIVKEALRVESNDIAALLLGDIQGKIGGGVLKEITGKYLASIKSQVKVNPKSVVGKVYSDEVYAGVDEWGGHLPAHDIAAKNARALHFLGTSGEVFAAVVHNPGANIAPHPAWHSTYLEEKDDIAARLTAAAVTKASGVLDQSEAGND